MNNKMLVMQLYPRGNLPRYAASIRGPCTSTILHKSSDSSSSDSSSSDSDKKDKRKKLESKSDRDNIIGEKKKLEYRQATTDRLNNILSKMLEGKPVKTHLDLSIPPKVKKQKSNPKSMNKPYAETVTDAAEEVATSLGGNVQKTKSDLLEKLLAAKMVTSNEQKKEKSDASPSISELISNMKVDHTTENNNETSYRVQKLYRAQSASKQYKSTRTTNFNRWDYNKRSSEAGNLYQGTLLNIFKASNKTNEKLSHVPTLNTWEMLRNKEFKLALIHPPENILQEMILWTNQGKLWKFPIDNEQGMEEEQNIHFSEHVFMERHLQDWCPKRGPIRHFMELVCVGLSKNPYMTVNEKKEHIAWYREYFGTKQELLKELGAIDGEIPQKSKQIEA